jgi:twitching motility protein PilT
MIPTAAIRNLIREDKIHQVYSSMQTGQDASGMQTMNQSLAHWVKQGQLSKQHALDFSPVPDELSKMLASVIEKR